MKRKEMIEHINDFLEKNGKFDSFGKRVLATQFLSFIESKGMLPPTYVNGFFTAPYLGCDSTEVEWVEESVNEWEPENEEK
jgi:hypothetical protein